MADSKVSGLVVVLDFVRASLEGSGLDKFDLLTGGNVNTCALGPGIGW